MFIECNFIHAISHNGWFTTVVDPCVIMADIEESVENVDSPFSGQDFSDFDPPPPEFLLAMMQKLTGLTDVDRKELMQKLLTQEFLQGQEPVGLVRQLLSSQLFVLLTLSSVTATVFGKKFTQVSNIKCQFLVILYF